MISLTKVDMQEATRLTREGRLDEAMALIRGARTESASAPKPDMPRMRSGLSPRGAFGGMKEINPAAGVRGVRLPGASPAAPPVPQGARYEERSYANATGSRSYKIYVPSSYAGEPVPLVVMLHGCTQSPDDFALGTRMNDLGEEQRFIVAYPAQAQSANVSKCWNWFREGDQRRDGGEPSLIAGITREIMQEFSIDAGRVYVAGLSAGGAAAAIMGATHPELYAAIGVHSGLACGAARDLPSAMAAMRQGSPGSGVAARRSRAIVFHGDRDQTVHPVNGDQVIAQSKAGAGFETSISRGEEVGLSYTRTVHADAAGRPMFEHWALHGAGHAWSGGSPSGSYTDPRGPDASREMVRFFFADPERPD